MPVNTYLNASKYLPGGKWRTYGQKCNLLENFLGFNTLGGLLRMSAFAYLFNLERIIFIYLMN